MKRIIVALAIAMTAPAALAQLPDQQAVRTIGPDHKQTLVGWHATPEPKAPGILRTTLHIEPDNKVFAGAKAFSSALRETDAAIAAKKAAEAEAFVSTKMLATAKVKQPVMDRIEKGGWASIVMLEGTMAGKPARFVGSVWYGARGEPDGKAAAGVMGFVAPEPVFVALGGYAAPVILFNNAAATPNTPMSADGSKPPQQAVNEFADLFAAWAAGLGSGDNLTALNGIMNGNLGVKSGTGCINTYGCVGGGMPPIRTPNY